jgi:hypothetical protein
VSITKNQLDAINSGALAKIGQNAEDPSFKATNLLEEMLLGVAQKLTDAIVADIVKKKATASGNLIQSFDASKVYKVADGVTAEIRAADYWYYVDQGRGSTRKGHTPGTPFLWEHIQDWLFRKGIGTPANFKKDGNSVEEARENFARAIAKKIHRKGTIKRFGYKGADFVADVLNPTAVNAIAQHLGEALGQRIAISVKMVEGTPKE